MRIVFKSMRPLFIPGEGYDSGGYVFIGYVPTGYVPEGHPPEGHLPLSPREGVPPSRGVEPNPSQGKREPNPSLGNPSLKREEPDRFIGERRGIVTKRDDTNRGFKLFINPILLFIISLFRTIIPLFRPIIPVSRSITPLSNSLSPSPLIKLLPSFLLSFPRLLLTRLLSTRLLSTRLLLTLLLLSLLLLFSLLPSPLYAAGELARAREAREAFFNGEEVKNRSSWLKLISQFENAAKAQVKDEWRSQAQLETAELSLLSYYRFKDLKDASRAETLTRAIAKNCGRCPAAPKAVILLGRALTAQKRMDDAYRELMKVELNHPGAALEIEEARELMSALRAGATPPPIPTPEPTIVSLKSDAGGREAQGGASGASGPPGTPGSPGSQGVSGSSGASGSSGKEAAGASAPRGSPGGGAPAARKEPPRQVTPPVKTPPPRKDGLAQVYWVSLEDQGDYTTVTAFSDRVTSYVYNLIPPQRSGGSHRVYVDIRDARLGPGIPVSLKKTTNLVRLVKVNQFNEKTVRVVIDLPEAYPYSPMFLSDPPRMTVGIAKNSYDLPIYPSSEAPPEPRLTVIKPPLESSRGARGPAESMARQLGLKIKRVVIDPGHGGKDSGATGHGLREKDIALKAGKLLKSKIEKSLGIEVILTRDTDKFVTLDRRPKIVRDKEGDLFISIHANANTLSSVEGLETYLLNFSSDPSAQTVAARENASSDKSMSEMNDILELIAKNTKISESRVLAKTIHSAALSSLRTKYKVRDLGVKEAVFVVLVNVKVPAILMEIGFLSNKSEAARLGEDAYLELLTDGIVAGLKNYTEGLPH
jgi:N-acetylmuramoyl-L-alanine amidase